MAAYQGILEGAQANQHTAALKSVQLEHSTYSKLWTVMDFSRSIKATQCIQSPGISRQSSICSAENRVQLRRDLGSVFGCHLIQSPIQAERELHGLSSSDSTETHPKFSAKKSTTADRMNWVTPLILK